MPSDPFEPHKPLDVDLLRDALLADPASAVRLLRERAREGEPLAQLLLGQLLINGVGAERDPEEALHWFRVAASAGLPMAVNMVGRCYEYGYGTPVDYPMASVWFRRAAELGCDWAVYNYAHLLANGRGVARDRAAAFAHFQRAADMGHARSLHFLGQYYENGWETPRNGAAAIECYQRSAEGGDFRGQCSYASMLAEQGRVDEAVGWITRAVPSVTPAYGRQLAAVLDESPHPAFRAIAQTLRCRLDAHNDSNQTTHDATRITHPEAARP